MRRALGTNSGERANVDPQLQLGTLVVAEVALGFFLDTLAPDALDDTDPVDLLDLAAQQNALALTVIRERLGPIVPPAHICAALALAREAAKLTKAYFMGRMYASFIAIPVGWVIISLFGVEGTISPPAIAFSPLVNPPAKPSE